MRRPADNPKALQRTWAAMQATGWHSSWIGGLFAARIWFTPWAVDNHDRARQRHARWLEGADRITVPFKRKRLAGFAIGEGPTVLLVHGWGERAATLGALVKPLVARGYRVVGVDLPAHGDSPGRRTDIPEGAEAVRATIDHLGGVYAVIAHSMGGAVASVALARGAEVERLVLIGSAVRLENALEVFAEISQLPPRAKAGLRRYIERRFGHNVWREFATDRLARDIPVAPLIVHDKDDDQVAFADGVMLAKAWPGAHFLATERLGHIKVMGDPKVMEAIVGWLSDPVHLERRTKNLQAS
jgi:pimeloyl-ACP methyl ester carboxylesterase